MGKKLEPHPTVPSPDSTAGSGHSSLQSCHTFSLSPLFGSTDFNTKLSLNEVLVGADIPGGWERSLNLILKCHHQTLQRAVVTPAGQWSLLPVFSAGGPCEQFWQEQIGPFFDVVYPAFPLPTKASPTLKGALKDGFEEAVMVCGLPEPCKFPSLDSGQKRFLWTHKEIDLAPAPSHWSCAPSKRYREVFSCAWF